MKIVNIAQSRLAVLAALSVLATSAPSAEPDFRTDINPALLYFQAYQEMPELNEADRKHLFESRTGGAWPDQPFDDRALRLIRGYDNSFKLLHRARFSRVPCDWGYDLTDGPEALLGGLAPAKRLAQVTRFRAMVALDANHFGALLDDVASAHTLGRNLSTDRVLISALVQFAIENILVSIVMENYYRLSPAQLDQLVTVFDSGPRRGLIADTIPTEHDAFYGYILRKVQSMAAASKGDDARFWKEFASFWNSIATDAETKTGPDPSADQIQQASGGTVAGVLRRLEEMPPLYRETAQIMSAPYREYREKLGAFTAKINTPQNPFIKQFFSLFQRVREKEFRTLLRHEMVRAAAAYKRGGMAALQAVQNPLVGGPFEFSRVEFEGVDRGFQLKSREQIHDDPEVMIFLEKPGKHFRLDGRNAGTAL